MESGSRKNINSENKRVKKLGEIIASGFNGNETDSDDVLITRLLKYRQDKREQIHKTSVPSDDMWDSIEQHIDSKKSSEEATLHKLHHRNHLLRIWIPAAAAVLLAFLGIYYFIQPVSNTNNHLIAESEATKITYTTSNGSKITLRPYSKLYLIHKSSSLMQYKLKGEAYFDVIHNPNRKFVVEAGYGEVRDLGTRFNVSDWGNIVQIYLQKGSVFFKNKKTNQHVVLKPGESCTITQKGKLLKPKKQKQTQYLDWLHNEMDFNHQKVNLVFDELEQHYNIKIEKKNLTHKFLSETITGQIHLKSLQKSLKSLGLVLSGHFKQIGHNQYKFIPIK